MIVATHSASAAPARRLPAALASPRSPFSAPETRPCGCVLTPAPAADDTIQPGNCKNAVSKLGDYLVENGV